ncbi:BTAD domain-containing putative transcriptional regulator [uncultured Jatrophihabitans sp.]|uniref:BTAD domain-containing putative transcriptional regulator n=1 Tax=uncultured Jatrophihabitans sp. TaxID=1610747 RepID=UPI0035CC4217
MHDVTGIEFSVLGPLRARAAGRAAELGPGRRRTTLAALLVDVGHVVPLDVVVARVWDDEPPDNPAAAVHSYVSRLRAALRTVDQDGNQTMAPLLTQAPGYLLAVQPQSVDAVVFERLLDDARRLRPVDAAAARDRIDEALALWRGRPYADITARFAETESTRLQSLHTAAQELAIDCDLELGRHVYVEQIEAMLAVDPLRETLHGALMLTLYRGGRQAEALRQFDLLRRTLAEELGMDPSPDLRDLHARILRQDSSLNAPAAEPGVRRARQVPAPASQSEFAASLRMVGREGELERLQEVLRRAWKSGDSVATAIVGEAGIGKSRLLEESSALAAREGVVVAWGRCWQHDGAPTLWPWLQVLRAVAAAVSRDILANAVTGRGAAVRSILPELGATNWPVSPPADPESLEESQVRLFDSVTSFFETVGAEQRLLLVLEDMHWADPASRRLAEYLVTHVAGTGLAVLLSVRSPSEDAATPGRELLAALARTGRSERIALTGLHADAVRLHVADRIGAHLDDATAQALVDRTEGNPFFVGEIVQLLVADPAGRDGGSGSTHQVSAGVPDSVREVVLRRLHQLGEAHLGVLRSAAVVGRTFDLDLLHEVSGAGLDDVDEAVDHATEAGFLCSEAGAVGQHRFTHAIVQQALFEDTGPARRRRLHAQIAEVLRAGSGVGVTRHADRLIHHLAQAGGSENLDEAAGLCLAVADAAARQANYPEVETLLLQALDYATRIDGPNAESRELSTRVRLCSLYDYFCRPDYPATAGHRQRALELARRSARGRDLVAILNSAASTTLGAANFPSTAAIVQEMRVTAEATDDPVLEAAAYLADALTLVQQGRFEETITACTRTVTVMEQFDTEPWSNVMLTPFEATYGWRLFAFAMVGRADPDTDPAVAADLARTRELAASPVPSISGNVEGLLALYFAVRDRPADALPHAARAVEIAAATGNLSVLAYLRIVAAWAAPDASEEHLDEAMGAVEGPAAVVMRPFLRLLAADAHLRAGRPERARLLHEQASAEAEATGNRLFPPGPLRRLAGLTSTGVSASVVRRREA